MSVSDKALERSTLAMVLGERLQKIIRTISKGQQGIPLEANDLAPLEDARLLLNEYREVFVWCASNQVAKDPLRYGYLFAIAPLTWRSGRQATVTAEIERMVATVNEALEGKFIVVDRFEDLLTFADHLFTQTLNDFGQDV
jgi:hypothetical protein